MAVVCDSTCYLPNDWAAREGIGIVPVQVIVAGRSFDETDGDQARAVAQALRDWQPVTTSRPTPARFLEAYGAAAAGGARHIVVATLSAAMSSTYESALLAARDSSLQVTVVDSATIGMALGFAVVAGARAARDGADAERVAGIIGARARASSTYFMVDTLEYLRRGGRIGAARAAVGQALKVKPLLTVRDGAVESLEQVRTTGRALARLEDLAVADALAAGGDVDIAVQHLDAADPARTLADRLAARVPGTVIVECPIGGVVGAHVGPGVVSVAVSPRVDA